MNFLDNIKLFLLDMDGTFYLDNTLLPGAADFLELCRKENKAFAFLTNNSSKSASDYLAKLSALGVEVSRRELFTSADATLLYLAEKKYDKNILLIGTKSLERQFCENGYTINSENPSAVVLGFDTEINYEKLTLLCNAVRFGIPYIATHPDFNCPVQGGYIPDIGAVIAFVKASTGREPTAVIGKPNPYIALAAAKSYGVDISEICMVGDRLYTDIALGQSGCKSVFVLSGEGTLDEMKKGGYQPNLVCENMAELTDILRAQ